MQSSNGTRSKGDGNDDDAATNAATNAATDADADAAADASVDSWFLEQTLCYHEDRTRARGVLRCELWLSRRRGTGSSAPDVVDCWHPKGSNTEECSSSSSQSRPYTKKNTRLYHSKKNTESSSATLLGERLANRLWSYHRDVPEPGNILWRRFGWLTHTDTTTCSPSQSYTDHHRQWKVASERMPYDWIASIPFEVPAVVSSAAAFRRAGGGTVSSASGSTNGRGSEWLAANYRGMVCWLFERTDGPPSGENRSPDHPSASIECFLRSATDHIAETYALESFRHLPLPRERRNSSSSSSSSSSGSHHNTSQRHNNRDTETSDRNSNVIEITIADPTIRKMKKMPPGLSYNDEFESQETMTSFEVNGIAEMDGDDDNDDNDSSIKDCPSKGLAMLSVYFRKFRGCGLKGPQPLCPKQTLFTFVGSFVTIYLIHLFNAFLMERDNYGNTSTGTSSTSGSGSSNYATNRDSETALVIGPFGASCVLVFAMTSAAPSQPRSMLVGGAIGMVVGKLTGYLGVLGVGPGIRMSLATALTACIMARTCTIYPPAGALALIFSSQLLGWDRFVLQVIGTLLTIGLAVVLNNLHPMRTYPAFWLGIPDQEECCIANKGDGTLRKRRSKIKSGGCQNP